MSEDKTIKGYYYPLVTFKGYNYIAAARRLNAADQSYFKDVNLDSEEADFEIMDLIDEAKEKVFPMTDIERNWALVYKTDEFYGSDGGIQIISKKDFEGMGVKFNVQPSELHKLRYFSLTYYTGCDCPLIFE
jgi:hypothetical protein